MSCIHWSSCLQRSQYCCTTHDHHCSACWHTDLADDSSLPDHSAQPRSHCLLGVSRSPEVSAVGQLHSLTGVGQETSSEHWSIDYLMLTQQTADYSLVSPLVYSADYPPVIVLFQCEEALWSCVLMDCSPGMFLSIDTNCWYHWRIHQSSLFLHSWPSEVRSSAPWSENWIPETKNMRNRKKGSCLQMKHHLCRQQTVW